jgi:translation initiation factor eIF-2B subunit epsilon
LKISEHNKSNKYFHLPIELFQNAYSPLKQLKIQQQNIDLNKAKFEKQVASNIGVQSILQPYTMNSISHLKTIQHRNDLVEAQIYLCSPYVLHMFTDNFDYNTMADFVRGVLAEEEVAGYTVYIDLIKKKFNSHYSIINNINSYYFETMSLVQHFDLVLSKQERAGYDRIADKINVYINKNLVKFGTNVSIERNCFIESGCQYGDNCELINCYIGANVLIGNNVKLTNCIIFPNCHIGNDSNLNCVLLGYNVKIGNNCKICENCLFASDCHVKDNTNITQRGLFKSYLNLNNIFN